MSRSALKTRVRSQLFSAGRMLSARSMPYRNRLNGLRVRREQSAHGMQKSLKGLNGADRWRKSCRMLLED